MADIYRTVASLSFVGDDLDPDEISRGLGEPTKGARKGGILLTPGGTERVSHTGIWLLQTEDAQPGNLDHQILALFSPLSENIDIWKDFAGRYRGRIFVGLFLSTSNEGLGISPQALSAIGVRGLELDLDVYSGNVDEAEVGDIQSSK
ncbi:MULTISPECIES: DUF4279 domain-containing protein [unclassified Rhizobium]|uniref:DUF4279 domain-containing protein n=1 Tax=unclassified Rhizobium TaxID=2613769 RepID=UPI0007E9FB93|nr:MULTISPECIES: DUF4279 domain-containing protein [unclassified Rhizobium]ANM14051.1 hypothetical protein AMK05_PD00150 [Rhizobium sp. N324]ANM20431.1 hypothetical protein AMK06_PD00152 [Rhizobium sp. N541]ANM26815.1 hypothetical protein AMK07_PD00152 [Rhizobium sp. N941]OYD00220.1 hypothetical protein AMK08_PD00150 [Rhizobium sp. N4311]